jgi:flagellar basal-body rod modification protein FlgD
MSAVQNNSSVVAGLGLSGSSTAKADTTEDRFLKLLVTQMKNQDPLNPMDNAQVTSQMAQLSTVTGIEKLNATLQSMSTAFTSSQSLQAAAMIGHGVMTAGSSLTLAGGAAFGGVELQQPVDSLVVTISDKAGNKLHSENLGPQQAGVVPFQWDGSTDSGVAAADGAYTFKVEAAQGGNKVSATTLSVGLVDSVSLGSQGVMLNLGNGLGAIGLSQVNRIL